MKPAITKSFSVARKQMLFSIALTLLVSAACGGDSDEEDPGPNGDRGSVTLTIGEETWTFDNFSCFVGADVTRSTEYPFNTNTISEIDGVRIQLQAEYRDKDDEGKLEGDSVVHTIYINDIDNPTDKTIDFESSSEAGVLDMPPSGNTVITINDNIISGSGMFDDKLTENDFTLIPGTLEGRCAP